MKVAMLAFGILLGPIAVGVAMAQSQTDWRKAGRDPYITSTGETVDKPGQSQSGGTTALDRKIQRKNNRIDRSICRGC